MDVPWLIFRVSSLRSLMLEDNAVKRPFYHYVFEPANPLGLTDSRAKVSLTFKNCKFLTHFLFRTQEMHIDCQYFYFLSLIRVSLHHNTSTCEETESFRHEEWIISFFLPLKTLTAVSKSTFSTNLFTPFQPIIYHKKWYV